MHALKLKDVPDALPAYGGDSTLNCRLYAHLKPLERLFHRRLTRRATVGLNFG
jgi:hypothetical protein